MQFDEETGFYHTWFRQYDPSQGRWLSIDPLSGSEADSQSLNRYTYVLNDSVMLVDLLGLDECTWNPPTLHCRVDPINPTDQDLPGSLRGQGRRVGGGGTRPVCAGSGAWRLKVVV
jgi:RHS repeat-associated protein